MLPKASLGDFMAPLPKLFMLWVALLPPPPCALNRLLQSI